MHAQHECPTFLKDFSRFATNLGLNKKQIKNVYKRFSKAIPETCTVIDHGFLLDNKAKAYKQLITGKAIRLELL